MKTYKKFIKLFETSGCTEVNFAGERFSFNIFLVAKILTCLRKFVDAIFKLDKGMYACSLIRKQTN